jgi:transglutaminase-like putative cysteine protease
MWARLERPARAGDFALMAFLAALPALVPRFRLLVLVGVALLAARVSIHLSPHRFRQGFLGFYDVAVPFDPGRHHSMHGDLELAVFGFTAAIGLALALRRRFIAVVVLLVGAGWPATLVGGGSQLLRGSLILVGVLMLLAERAPRPALAAAAAVVLAATAASTSPALARDELLNWQRWDIHSASRRSVDVTFAWNAVYSGIDFPKRATMVFTATGPSQSHYWRATTLDIFADDRWFERLLPWVPARTRIDFSKADLMPTAGLQRQARLEQRITIAGLADAHLVGAGEPIGFDTSGAASIQYAGDGKAMVVGALRRGEKYTAWSYAANPDPAALSRSSTRYPPAVVNQGYLDFENGVRFPVFGRPRLAVAGPYAPLYRQAERVAGDAPTPYAAAVALEGWFRRTGGFRYDEHPQRTSGPPLVAFALRTKRGYCQHFAGAMALMLRMLGVPARVAVGFTPGRYDTRTGVWTVTDRDAHAWVEAWFPGYGWLPFDPTPGRAQLDGSYSASSAGFDPRALLRALRDGGSATAFERRLDRQFSRTVVRGSGPDLPGNGGHVSPASPRRPSLLRLLGLVAAGLVVAIALAKVGLRRSRYLRSRDARGTASACLRELADVLRDQGVRVPDSATPGELAELAREATGVDARRFAAAADRARFSRAPAPDEARSELRALKRSLRRELTYVARLRGFLSLRSLGLSG